MILSTSSMLIRDLSMSDLNLYLFMCKCVINNEQLLLGQLFFGPYAVRVVGHAVIMGAVHIY